MSVPLATYRIQLRQGMDFAAVAALAPYLARLGLSHCYLSPITTAMPGSTHGYDVIDFATIEPALGGRDGFLAMAKALRQHGLAILLDIVPNHMAASPKNGWWRDVLEWGQASPRASSFDIDWSAPKLLIPVLGTHYVTALADGALTLVCDPTTGTLVLRYGALELPLTPPSYSHVLGLAEGDGFAELSLRFAASSPGSAPELKAALSDLLAGNVVPLEAALAAINADKDVLHRLLEQQVWRLAHWRLARENLTYRRFFEISDLVGVRVEEPTVFDDVHGCIVDLVREGFVDGLRIDHIDGLADPLGYLRRLRSAVGEDTYIVVEKILGAGESLRPSWPVAGTTGYEFIAALARLFTQTETQALADAYEDVAGGASDLDTAVTVAKRRTFNRNLAGELDHLTHLAVDLAQSDVATRDLGADTLRRAIVEVASAFPVYRTFVDAAGPAPEDCNLLGRAVARARSTGEVEDETAFDVLAELLTLAASTPERQAAALGFATRFQQTTGPLMAKSLEDTVFYRFNRLIALNEVGGDPAFENSAADAIHDLFRERRATAPCALSATATHDTKRGEDARARLYAISETPEAWAAAVVRWMRLNAPLSASVDGAAVPDPNTEWLYYQALLGAWPLDLAPDDNAGLAELADRMAAFMIKAAREAKISTNWTRPDAAYEAALDAFVRQSLEPQRSAAFLSDFMSTARPLFRAGCAMSLAQTVIKAFAPGVPDIYQGTELWDLALVDPDNRRPVDYAVRRAFLDLSDHDPLQWLARWQDGAIKLRVLEDALAARARFGTDILRADYVPLRAEGPRADHVFAFARATADKTAIVIVARFLSGLFDETGRPTLRSGIWNGTRITCPPELNTRQLLGMFNPHGVSIRDGCIELEQVLNTFPVAVLTN